MYRRQSNPPMSNFRGSIEPEYSMPIYSAGISTTGLPCTSLGPAGSYDKKRIVEYMNY